LGVKTFGGDDFWGGAAGVEHGGEDFLPTAPVIFADSTSITSSARAAGETGLAVIPCRNSSAANKLGLHPVGRGLPGAPALTNGLEIIGEG